MPLHASLHASAGIYSRSPFVQCQLASKLLVRVFDALGVLTLRKESGPRETKHDTNPNAHADARGEIFKSTTPGKAYP